MWRVCVSVSSQGGEGRRWREEKENQEEKKKSTRKRRTEVFGYMI
jgi:hypothetical protein